MLLDRRRSLLSLLPTLSLGLSLPRLVRPRTLFYGKFLLIILEGPQVFLARDAPRYFIAFSTHLVCYSLLVLVIIFLRIHLKRHNDKKDAVAPFDPTLTTAFDDLTDRENGNFRYIY